MRRVVLLVDPVTRPQLAHMWFQCCFQSSAPSPVHNTPEARDMARGNCDWLKECGARLHGYTRLRMHAPPSPSSSGKASLNHGMRRHNTPQFTQGKLLYTVAQRPSHNK